MKLYEEHAALRDRFEVLAIHDNRAKTLEEMDERLAPIIEKRWNGKTLPFPILLDGEGRTVKAYGVSAFPTTVLIDPDGNVVKGDGEKNLAKVLERLAAEASAEEPDDSGDSPAER